VEIYNLAITTIWITSWYFFALRPMLKAAKTKTEKEFKRDLRNFKLYCVKQHYPYVENLDYKTIESTFNIEKSYYNIRFK
jgi:hypothetical protein